MTDPQHTTFRPRLAGLAAHIATALAPMDRCRLQPSPTYLLRGRWAVSRSRRSANTDSRMWAGRITPNTLCRRRVLAQGQQLLSTSLRFWAPAPLAACKVPPLHATSLGA